MVRFHSSSLPTGQAHRSIGQYEQILKDVFGLSAFRGVQRPAIDALLAGNDVLALMPTGGGKSLCYQVPALMLDGTALVISPLIALMRDQADSLRRKGIRAAALIGGDAMPMQERVEIEGAMAAGSLDILFVSPERLASDRFRQLLSQVKLSLVAIDEAHCVCDWGKDFRPDYRRIDEMLSGFERVPRIALTATATVGMQAEIAELLLKEARVFNGGFDRPNIEIDVVERGDLAQQLGDLLRERLQLGSALVYCNSRRQTEEVSRLLAAQGFSAGAYHAGLDAVDRSKVQDQFVSGHLSVVIATSAFGMGIDKADVATVAHVETPSSIEAYYQESGRAGRDGRQALSWIAVARADVAKRMRIIHTGEDGGKRRHEMARFEAVMAFIEAPICRRRALLQTFGQVLHEPCGNCDLCHRQQTLENATSKVRILLEAVYDLRVDATPGTISEVLAGKATPRVITAALQVSSAFGQLQSLGEDGVRRLLRQSLALGYLRLNERSGVVQVTRSGEDVMDGAGEAMLPAATSAPRGRRASSGEGLPQRRLDIWNGLVAARDRLAAGRGVDRDIVADDAVLAQIVSQEALPSELDSALAIEAAALLERGADRPAAPVAIDTGLF